MPRSKHSSPTLVLKITDELVDKATQSNSGGCLIADAIKDQYPHLSGVTVDMATIRVTDRKLGLRFTYLTPAPAQYCLLSFDQGWPNPVPEVTIRRAVKITRLIRSPQAVAAEHAARAERLAAAEAKLEAGEPLTRFEKATVTKARKHEEHPPVQRPASRGPAEVTIGTGGNTASAVVVGGDPLPLGPSHPNLLRGRDRHFGAKLADPGQAFRDAVDQALKEHLTTAAE